MTLGVEVQIAAADASLPSQRQLSDWALAAWQEEGTRDAEVVVRVTDEAESRRLNHEFRGRDKATNVLSFPFDPVPEIDLNHVGDLVICAPVVAREAVEQGKQAEAHWAHMVVHGMLHLQGYDHETDEQAVEMETLETEVLTGLGYPAPYAEEHGASGTSEKSGGRG
jgi:probable rRNA maturation factor